MSVPSFLTIHPIVVDLPINNAIHTAVPKQNNSENIQFTVIENKAMYQILEIRET